MKSRTTKKGAARGAKRKPRASANQLGFDFTKPSPRATKGKKKGTTKRKGVKKPGRKTTSRKSVASKEKKKQPLPLLHHWLHRKKNEVKSLEKRIRSLGGKV